MTETTMKFIKLTAEDNKVLTNGTDFGKEVYLGKNDKAENWHEIETSEYEAILKAQEEAENEDIYR